jgi:hypothetical protein
MDLIASIISWVLAFFASVLGNILAHDICSTADAACRTIIRRASRRLAAFECALVEQEWLADLHERETVFEKYRHAIGCFLAAGKMRRQAEAVTVLLNFQIDSVGTIPLTLNITSKLTRLSLAAGSSRFQWLRRTNALFLIAYLVFRFGSTTKKLGPGKVKKLADSLKHYKNWKYSARLQRKGLDIHLDNIFRAMVHHPTEAPAILGRVAEALKKMPQATPPV